MRTTIGAVLLSLALAPAAVLRADEGDGLPSACTVRTYIIRWDTCYLQTQVGNPAGWLIDQAGLVDNCWYHCISAPPPPNPSYQYEAYHHGPSWMRCATGSVYSPGIRGFDCVYPPHSGD